ncbi:hypothetical protein GCM10009716_39960 [Streptomyces sodiiphilus]|uniref:XRE family transcriptional regulator n=1 Tax=Streptomyces sodiiphilus TaxID=226217 RepID=A0ABN2PSW9_9ACTN
MHMLDPCELAARRFPLIPRGKPPCPPLDARLAQIRTRATDRTLLRAAQAHNLAALTASDTGQPELAHQLCIRQVTLFLAAQPFNADTAKLALQPLINIGRLLTRDGQGTAAYHLFEQLLAAAKSRTETEISGTTVSFARLTTSAAEHREIVRWLWTVLLTDGTRALVQAGRWTEALHHAHQHNAIGQRLLDGRQIAILAHSATGDHEIALATLDASDTAAPWETTVAATLRTLCLTRADQDSGTAATQMADRYLALDDPGRDHSAFRTRLGLCALDLTPDPATRPRITDALTRQALEAQDAYTARDLLTHRSGNATAGTDTRSALQDLVHAAALGRGTLPTEQQADLLESARLSETTLAATLHKHRSRPEKVR